MLPCEYAISNGTCWFRFHDASVRPGDNITVEWTDLHPNDYTKIYDDGAVTIVL